jgi:hypothetical protein
MLASSISCQHDWPCYLYVICLYLPFQAEKTHRRFNFAQPVRYTLLHSLDSKAWKLGNCAENVALMYTMGLLGNKYGFGRHRNVLPGNTDVEVGYCILCKAVYCTSKQQYTSMHTSKAGSQISKL